MKTNMEKCNSIVKEDNDLIMAASRMPYFPLVVNSGYGAIVEDVDGNKFIDMLSSAASANTGHSHSKVVQAITKQAKKLINYTSGYMYSELQIELAKTLIEITPGNFKKKVAFGLSGSDSNDGMIKLARAYTGRSNIISFIGSYHGTTYGSISLSAISLNMSAKIGPLLPGIHHINYPNCYRCRFCKNEDNCSLECFEELEEAFKYYLSPKEVAAVIFEPLAGDFGIIVPPKKYVEKLYNICKQYGILFAVDEVQQGFGRTGKWFGIENFDIAPDIVVMGKSIASGMPLSAIVAREEIMESLDAPAHVLTTGGNAICCSAAIATINVIKEEGLLNNSLQLGDYAKQRFRKMQEKYDIIGDVRGIGLSIGIELVVDKKTKEKNKTAAAKICYRCWKKGAIVVYIAESVLRIQPPLVITKVQLDKALDIIEESICEYMSGSIPDEVLQIAKGW